MGRAIRSAAVSRQQVFFKMDTHFLASACQFRSSKTATRPYVVMPNIFPTMYPRRTCEAPPVSMRAGQKQGMGQNAYLFACGDVSANSLLFECQTVFCVIACFSLLLLGIAIQAVGEAARFPPSSVQNVGVDHRCANIPGAQEFLKSTDVIAVSQKVRCERVSNSSVDRRLPISSLSPCAAVPKDPCLPPVLILLSSPHVAAPIRRSAA